MQIILEETEIMDALTMYCEKQIAVPKGKTLDLDFTVGRGGNGTKATITFIDDTTKVDENEQKTPKKEESPKAEPEPPGMAENEQKTPKKEESPKAEPTVTAEVESHENVKSPPENTPKKVESSGDSLFNY